MAAWVAVKAAAGKTWAWIKAHWQWLLVPVGAVLWLIGRLMTRREPAQVVESEYVKHLDVKEKIDAQAVAQREAAAVAAREKLAGIEAGHASQTASVRQEAVADVDTIREDPEAVNDWLLKVGKDMRK